jgi:hypothetical protein
VASSSASINAAAARWPFSYFPCYPNVLCA